MERFGSAPHTKLFFGRSVRTIFSFVLAVFITVFLWATLSPQPAQAQGATAEWEGSSLRYDGRQYTESGEAKRDQFPGISEGAPYYIAGSADGRGHQGGNLPRDVFILYFSPGTDPPEATTAQHVKFQFAPMAQSYTNPSEQHSVTIEGEPGAAATTCDVPGIGWIVCPLTTFLATGMDWVFEQLTGFMVVQPLSTNQDSGLYVGWNIMRNFANVAFIIAFLIIVYAQLTGSFAGTYGIKKLLPRLIIAAVLVNISYIICALAVDLSNILGYSLQNLFIEMRNQIFHVDSETWNSEYMYSWESIAGFVLSGGTATLALGIGAFTALSYGTGAIFLLLPALMGLLVAVLVVLLILAARQAIITVLILIAPLAFVAYLLPNTENWFNRWRGLFMTMLIFFPAFAVVFGGSQLAGAIIIQNASSINILILGMIVQVAPLVITPFLLKFSGSLLGRIAGMVNNPNKGLIDRTRKYADGKAQLHRDRFHGNLDRKGRPRTGNISAARRLSQWAGNRSRNDEEQAANAKAAADNAYRNSSDYARLHDNAALINTDKETTDARLASRLETQKAAAGSQLNARTQILETEKQSLEAAKLRANIEVEKLRLDESSELHMNTLRTKAGEGTLDHLTAQNALKTEEYKSGKLVMTGEKDALMKEMKEASIQASAAKQGATSAQYEIQRGHSEAMNAESIAGESLRKLAAGVSGKVGETRARAHAVSMLNKLDDESLKSNIELIKAEAALRGTTFKNHSSEIVETVVNGGTSIHGKAIDNEQLKAALQMQAQEKNISLFEAARGSRTIDQALVSEVISMNIGEFKGGGGFHLQADPNLNVTVHGANFDREMAKARIATLGNVTATNMANLKAGWVAALASPEVLQQGVDNADLPSLIKAYRNVKTALTNPDVLATIGDRVDEIKTIEEALAQKISSYGQTPPDIEANE